jgi:diguanylate cyclase (GGDEF)-like protein/PAS domain S-box-containing protein
MSLVRGRTSNASTLAALEIAGMAVARLGADGHLVEAGANWERLTGASSARQLGAGWRDVWLHSDRTRVAEAAVQCLSDGHATLTRVRMDSDSSRWCDLRFGPAGDGAIVVAVEVTGDVIHGEQVKRLLSVVEETPDLVVIADRNGRSVYANAAARRVAGMSADEDPGAISFTRLRGRLTTSSRVLMETEALPAVSHGGMWSGEVAIHVEAGEVPLSMVLVGHRDGDDLDYVAAIARDISERKMLESRLAHQATHDALTGLPNRLLLLDRAEQALARAERSTTKVAVLFCDVDRFKVINDSLGHAAGDGALIETARRIAGVLRPSDTVARFGGDEFVVLCDQLAVDEDALIIAQRVLDALDVPLDISGHEVVLSASIGVAIAATSGVSPVDLIRDADAAMYRAKDLGRRRIEMFDVGVRERVMNRMELERDLRRALERNQLEVYYQPIVSALNGQVTGFEALLRWKHPERGLLTPDSFISLAEETGLIVPIGAWVLGEACRQLQRWRSMYLVATELDLSVNLSARQLAHPDLLSLVDDVLADTGLEPQRVVLEVTESVLLHEADAGVGMLHRLSRLGVRIAIDDFGTGYSSLAYLQTFPANVVKIDRGFVSGLGTSNEATEIVRLVVTLAEALGMTCVAEGVERTEQLHELRRLGVTRIQGFLFHRPMTADDAEQLLRAPRPSAVAMAPLGLLA